MAALAAPLLSACSRQEAKVQGLRLVNESQLSNSSFESVAHYQYLWDDQIKIAKVGEVDISPSGNYAIYSNAEGEVMLYRYKSLQPKIVVSKVAPFISDFAWNEDAGDTTITFENGKKKRLPLN